MEEENADLAGWREGGNLRTEWLKKDRQVFFCDSFPSCFIYFYLGQGRKERDAASAQILDNDALSGLCRPETEVGSLITDTNAVVALSSLHSFSAPSLTIPTLAPNGLVRFSSSIFRDNLDHCVPLWRSIRTRGGARTTTDIRPRLFASQHPLVHIPGTSFILGLITCYTTPIPCTPCKCSFALYIITVFLSRIVPMHKSMPGNHAYGSTRTKRPMPSVFWTSG